MNVSTTKLGVAEKLPSPIKPHPQTIDTQDQVATRRASFSRSVNQTSTANQTSFRTLKTFSRSRPRRELVLLRVRGVSRRMIEPSRERDPFYRTGATSLAARGAISITCSAKAIRRRGVFRRVRALQYQAIHSKGGSMLLPREVDNLERAQLRPLGVFDLRASLVVLHSSQDDPWPFCCRDTARRL